MLELLDSAGLNLHLCFLNKTEDVTEEEPMSLETSRMLTRDDS